MPTQRRIVFGNLDSNPRDESRCFRIPRQHSALSKQLRAVLSNPDRKLPKPRVIAPISEDIAAGKNTYAYDAHTYHTKVPPQGIQSVIEHYADPGEFVLDPFCGSGMTGLAATACGRNVILSDLSPAAVFIAYNFLTPIDPVRFMRIVDEILERLLDEEFLLYGTVCRNCGRTVRQEYTVWSYGLQCSECRCEFLLWDVARLIGPTVRDSKIKSEIQCPHCAARLEKRLLRRTKLYPVEIGYKCCGSQQKEDTASPSATDLKRLSAIEEAGIPENLWYPRNSLPNGINTRQAI